MKRFAFLLLLLGLSGCNLSSGWNPESPPQPMEAKIGCPAVNVLPSLAEHSPVSIPGSANPFDVVAQAFLKTGDVKCDRGSPSNTVTFVVTVLASRGPAYQSQSLNLPYFVVVLDGNDNVLSKQVRPIVLAKLGKDGDMATERIAVDVPNTAQGYHIVLGFQISETEWQLQSR